MVHILSERVCKIKCDMESQVNENAIIKKLSIAGILGNVMLTAFKLFAGISGKSSAMISDAVHSLSDVFATGIAFWGVRLSKRSADKQHPYGHERMECVASLILGMILLATGVGIGKAGILRICCGAKDAWIVPRKIALIAAVVSIFSKEGMYWYTRYYAKILDSPAFMADAWHHRSDALSSIGSLVGIGGSMMGFPVLDLAASVLISLFILKVGVDILKDALMKMMDTSCGEDYEIRLRNYIVSQEGVENIDVLRSRMFGNKAYVDLEIAVDAEKSLQESHAIAEKIHAGVESKFPEVKHIMIHVNPAK